MGLSKVAIDFFTEVKVELSKVVWPTWGQTVKLTLIVIIITVSVGFFIGALDYLLTELMRLIIK